MHMKKISNCLIVSVLVLTMLYSMLSVAAQTNNSLQSLGSGSWQPPKNFVDPVTLKIQEFKLQGYTDDQITVELGKLGMGWYPETGATWVGQSLTPEELAKMPNTLININPPDICGPALQISRRSTMRTSSYSWTGVSAEVVCGSMSVGSGQTQNHYVCVQLGDLDGGSNWAETLVSHNYGETYKWYTYDSDEGGFAYYADKGTSTTSADTYVMLLDGTQDGNGWNYDVWINYQWVRSGHLSNLWVQGGLQKEVYSNGQFTNDASHSVFYRNWLHNAQGWSYWTNSIATGWTAASPLHETHSMGAVSYDWETWIQN
jgi:hypothetical protein